MDLTKSAAEALEVTYANRQAEGVLRLLAEGKTIDEVRELILGKLDARERRIVEMSVSGWKPFEIARQTGTDKLEIRDDIARLRNEIKGMQQIYSKLSMASQIAEVKARMLQILTKHMAKYDKLMSETDNGQVFARLFEGFANRCGVPVTQETNLTVQSQQDYMQGPQIRAVILALQVGQLQIEGADIPPDDEEVN